MGLTIPQSNLQHALNEKKKKAKFVVKNFPKSYICSPNGT